MRWSDDRVECALCGEALVGIAKTSKVRTVLIGASGQPNVRAIVVDGKEIHRCRSLFGHRSDLPRGEAAASRRSANREREAADRGGGGEAGHRRDALRHDAEAEHHEADAAGMDGDQDRRRE